MFCRRTALLLEAIGVPEAHIDVDEHGGAAGVVAQLGRSEDYPLKGIPVVFAAVRISRRFSPISPRFFPIFPPVF